MIEEIQLESWAAFHQKVGCLRTEYSHFRGANAASQSGPTVLFRGHSDAKWKLESTLVRTYGSPYRYLLYYALVNRTVDHVNSVTDKDWQVTDFPDIQKSLPGCPPGITSLHAYEYLIYLRHRGFPSPLLDWTTSPYVAAFFAFADARHSGSVAIYCYVETATGVKGRSGTEPYILVPGPFVKTDPRHFAQKSWYTCAVGCEEKTQQITFCSHEEVWGLDREDQDLVFKLIIPASERLSALRDLYDYNIDAFTLFQDEDGLVRSLAVKEFDLRLE